MYSLMSYKEFYRLGRLFKGDTLQDKSFCSPSLIAASLFLKRTKLEGHGMKILLRGPRGTCYLATPLATGIQSLILVARTAGEKLPEGYDDTTFVVLIKVCHYTYMQ